MTDFALIWLCKEPIRLARHPLANAYGRNLRLVAYSEVERQRRVSNRLIDFEVAYGNAGIKTGVVIVSDCAVLNADKLVEECATYQTVFGSRCMVFNHTSADANLWPTQIQKRPPLPELKWPLVFDARFPALIYP